MQRRSFLRATLVSGGLAVAGCLGDSTDEAGSDETVLGPPDREYDVDPADLAYPGYGEELPDVTLPSPLHDTDIATREFVESRETLLTFVFTRCPGPCPALTATLAQVQTTAVEEGFEDEIACLPVTFDPEYDTTERLQEFSETNGADPTAQNWQFLRPESPERAETVVGDDFGVAFEEVPVEESDHGDGHDENEETGDGGHEDDHGEALETEDEEQETTFVHSNLLLLVNRDGFVERAYARDPPRPDIVLGHLDAVREEYE